jgi:hypothetical protein
MHSQKPCSSILHIPSDPSFSPSKLHTLSYHSMVVVLMESMSGEEEFIC